MEIEESIKRKYWEVLDDIVATKAFMEILSMELEIHTGVHFGFCTLIHLWVAITWFKRDSHLVIFRTKINATTF